MEHVRRRVALVITGGTIDSLGRDRLDLAEYGLSGDRLPPDELLSRIPELAEIADLVVIPFARLPSTAIAAKDWVALATTICELAEGGDVDAVVVTHGTNTLEETAYFLSLTVPGNFPVVVVGAMRPASALSPDGDLNLLNAVRTSVSAASRERGVVVVMNDTIFSPRSVTKATTYRADAFESRDRGPLGTIDADGAIRYEDAGEAVRGGGEEPFFALGPDVTLPRVDIVLSYPGQDGVMIDAVVAAGAKGLVSAGSGAGKTTPLERAAYDRALAAGVAVVQCSRVGSGRVLDTETLAARGLAVGGGLSPMKARVLLMLALSDGQSGRHLRETFRRW